MHEAVYIISVNKENKEIRFSVFGMRTGEILKDITQ